MPKHLRNITVFFQKDKSDWLQETEHDVTVIQRGGVMVRESAVRFSVVVIPADEHWQQTE